MWYNNVIHLKAMEKTLKKEKKKYNIKPKPAHRMVAEILKDNRGSLKDAMITAGYSEVTAKTPQNVTESKGFQAVMNECGLTESFIASALYDDIRKKPQRRVKELELAAKIKRMTANEASTGTNILNIISFNGSTKPFSDDASQNV